MRLAANALVVIGYVVALPILVRIRAVFGERRSGWFAAFEGALVALSVGHLLAGRPAAAAINAAAAVVLAGAWWETGRRRRRT